MFHSVDLCSKHSIVMRQLCHRTYSWEGCVCGKLEAVGLVCVEIMKCHIVGPCRWTWEVLCSGKLLQVDSKLWQYLLCWGTKIEQGHTLGSLHTGSDVRAMALRHPKHIWMFITCGHQHSVSVSKSLQTLWSVYIICWHYPGGFMSLLCIHPAQMHLSPSESFAIGLLDFHLWKSSLPSCLPRVCEVMGPASFLQRLLQAAFKSELHVRPCPAFPPWRVWPVRWPS